MTSAKQLTLADVRVALRTASSKEFAHMPNRTAEIGFWKRKLATLQQTRETREK
jgi:hypothetical protein